MRLRFWVLAAVGLCVTSASADEFSEFRIPSHRAGNWTLSLAARAQQDEMSQYSARSTNGNGNAGTQAFWLSDSDPARTVLSASFLASGNWTHAQVDPSAPYPDEQHDTSALENWSATVDDRRYPWAMPLGFETALLAYGVYRQDWRKTSQTEPAGPGTFSQLVSSQSWQYNNGAVANIAAGWGRVRDATGVFDARMIEERLRAAGLLTRALSESARRRLAQLMYARGTFDEVTDRPARSLWEAIGAIVRDDGALGDAASDPGAWARAFEPYVGASRGNTGDLVPFAPFPRQTGYFVAPTIQLEHLNFVARLDGASDFAVYEGDSLINSGSGTSSQRFETDHRAVFTGVQAEIHHPVGIHCQLDAATQGLVPLTGEGDNRFALISNALVGYVVPDHWSARLEGQHVRAIQNESLRYPIDGWVLNLLSEIDFYIEDRLTLGLTLGHAQGEIVPHQFRKSSEATIALTYRIAGGFNAPGLLTPTLGRPAMP